jgi:tight adherence protein B
MILWIGLLMSAIAIGLLCFNLFRSAGSTRQAATARLARFIGGEADTPETAENPANAKESLFRRRPWDRKLAQLAFGRGLEQELTEANLKWRVSEYVAFSLISGAAVFMVALMIIGNPALSLLVATVGLLVPKFYVARRRKQRLKLLNEQLIPLLDVLVGSLRAGYSFLQGLESANSELTPPMSDEIGQVLREVSLGVSTEEALERLSQRTADPDLDMVVTSVLIQRRVGGNLGEVLSNISHTMRERIRIRGEIQTLTAQGRMSAIIISLIPIGLMAAFYAMDRSYLEPMFTTTIGRGLLLGAAVSNVIGYLVIRRIVNIKV